MLREAPARRAGVPLVHTAGIEHQHPVDGLGVRSMRVPEDDRIDVREPAAQIARQATMWPEVTQAQSPQEGVRLLEPAAPIAVHDRDALVFDLDLSRYRKVQRLVVVSTHRLDMSDAAQGVERLFSVDVAGVNDQIDAPKAFENASRKLSYELGVMRIRHDSDALGHLEQLSWSLVSSIFTKRLDKLVSQEF